MRRWNRSWIALAVTAVVCGALFLTPDIVPRLHGQAAEARRSSASASHLHEAAYYRNLDGKEVECRLCPRECLLRDGERGDCQVKENIGGTLYSLTYGRPCSLSLEPIEKAPLYHFFPGHTRLCIAAAGCNMRCKFCQNWQISQRPPEEVPVIAEYVSPDEVVALALDRGARSICFTFSEPTTFYEYMYDIADLARRHGLSTSMVSNGYINPKPLKRLLSVLTAVKIDLKSFTEEFYDEITFGELEPVLDTLKEIRSSGVWLEIVNLVIPTLNDDSEEIQSMCRWICQELGPDVPLHFTRFYPQYRLTSLPATPVGTLEAAWTIARNEGVRFVYVGNVMGHTNNSTFCPECGNPLIARTGFFVSVNRLAEGGCPDCGEQIAGLW